MSDHQMPDALGHSLDINDEALHRACLLAAWNSFNVIP